jgi:xylose dehydrogenase (NAD/NADP)
MNMTAKVRYGVLSTARIARNQHIRAAKTSANAEIAAISSRDKGTATQYAQELEIPKAYGSYQEVLDDPDIDAVINPLPNSMHCEWTVRAAKAGKHILCEKPFAVTVAEAQQMIDAARANGVLLMEGFTQRFLPQARYVRDLVDSGKIGTIRSVRAELVYTLPDWDTDSRAKPALAGGCLYDAGCYCVNTLRWAMGTEPIRVQAFQRIKEGYNVDATFAGLLEFPGGRLGYMLTGMEEPFRGCCEVIGSEGRIEMPDLFGGSRVRSIAGGEEHVETFEAADRFKLQIEHFSDCILNGKQPLLTLDDAKGNTVALVALKRAAIEGGTVAVAYP